MANKIGRNDPCWCGSGKKYKKCHEEFDDRIALYRSEGHEVPDRSIIKTPEQIAGIRESCKINIAVLDYVAEHIREGMTTQEIDDLVSSKTAELGGIPAPLHYEGYPKSVCTSVNEVVCHGIPSDQVVLKDGDIINVDVSTINKVISDIGNDSVNLRNRWVSNGELDNKVVFKHISKLLNVLSSVAANIKSEQL